MVFDITRRDFLLVNATASIAVLTQWRAGSELSSRERSTLMAIARTLFPHGRAGDKAYLKAIDRINQRCGCDGKLLDLMESGIAGIEWMCGGRFASSDETTRVSALKTIEKSSFFRLVYAELLEGLYGSPDIWAMAM